MDEDHWQRLDLLGLIAPSNISSALWVRQWTRASIYTTLFQQSYCLDHHELSKLVDADSFIVPDRLMDPSTYINLVIFPVCCDITACK